MVAGNSTTFIGNNHSRSSWLVVGICDEAWLRLLVHTKSQPTKTRQLHCWAGAAIGPYHLTQSRTAWASFCRRLPSPQRARAFSHRGLLPKRPTKPGASHGGAQPWQSPQARPRLKVRLRQARAQGYCARVLLLFGTKNWIRRGIVGSSDAPTCTCDCSNILSLVDEIDCPSFEKLRVFHLEGVVRLEPLIASRNSN